jgi:uncharacterized protein YpuA (DUF1002 family)
MRSSASKSSQRGLPTRGQRAAVLLMLTVVFFGLVARQGFAAESGKTIMLGESLNEAERAELLEYFGASRDDRIETVTLADTQAAMQGVINRQISSAYSSTALTCRELGEGLEVKTSNITVITPSLYAIALVTAGLGDGELLVAAPAAAPAEGLAALTGVFKTWDIAPCESGSTTEGRQRLALEELALAVDISLSLNTPTAIQDSGDLVLFVQQAVVIDGLTKADEISDAITEQESFLGFAVPAEQRTKLIDLMVRLAAEKIDWATFSAGWEITPNGDGTGISMKGDGIAIRNAQITATARAAEEMTATALAEEEAAAQTATAQAASDAESAMMTATAAAKLDAQVEADAQATQDAISAAMTATAAAIPTASPSPTPEPTATPEPYAITGTIDDIRGGQVFVETADGDSAIGYTVPVDASITRGGNGSTLSELRKGDTVNLTVDTVSQTVVRLNATAPAGQGIMSSLSKLIFLIPALAVIPLILFIRGRDMTGDPFIVKRVASA